jgi:hypothetical protein
MLVVAYSLAAAEPLEVRALTPRGRLVWEQTFRDEETPVEYAFAWRGDAYTATIEANEREWTYVLTRRQRNGTVTCARHVYNRYNPPAACSWGGSVGSGLGLELKRETAGTCWKPDVPLAPLVAHAIPPHPPLDPNRPHVSLSVAVPGRTAHLFPTVQAQSMYIVAGNDADTRPWEVQIAVTEISAEGARGVIAFRAVRRGILGHRTIAIGDLELPADRDVEVARGPVRATIRVEAATP